MAYTVDINDDVSAALKALPKELSLGRLNPAIGAGVVKLFQNHFLSRPKNKQGYPSTGFWAGAARATNWNLLADGVNISVNQQGVRQRLEGGEIRPVNAKYLAIPARAEAYGKLPGEFNDLVVERFGGKKSGSGGILALVQAQATQVSYGKKRKDGSQSRTATEVGGGVFFWLVKSVNQNADPDTIPSKEKIIEVAATVVSSAVERAQKKQGGAE